MRLRAARFIWPGVLLPTLNLIGLALVTISLYELVVSLGERRSGRLARAVYVVILAVVLLAGLARVDELVPILLIIAAAVLFAAMVRAARAAHEGDREARAIAAGLVVLVACLMADILRLSLRIAIPPGLPIVGFTTLFLVAASALNARYEREHRELIALQRELEQRVLDRTRELEDANQRLAEVSRTDSLTGLPNRRGFLEMSARATGPFSVVMVDLDHFKEINDRHGHAAGDDLLQAAASRLRAVMRAEDLVARWGGEEFILLLPHLDAAAAADAAEQARLALASRPFERNGAREAITASFGIAAHHEARPLEATIAAADQALYDAKAAGRNRVVVGG